MLRVLNLTVAQRAYIAGFVDGEAHVNPIKPMICIYQKDRRPLEWIQEVTGLGRIHGPYGVRDVPRLVFNRKSTRYLAEAIKDYSIVKRELLEAIKDAPRYSRVK